MENRIDFVIPWVDGNDPKWKREKEYWASTLNPSGENDHFREWNQSDIRFRDWNTLRFLFRGIERYAPWVNNVWFITWGHLPSWIDTGYSKLKIVNHRDYIPEKYLPTFNSHTIELNLHRINGLSEEFVYFNDDMFLTSSVVPDDFFINGLPCDSAILNPVPMTRKVRHAEINNVGIINDHFEKNKVIRQNFFKWFSHKYGKYLIRNVLLSPWKRFVGFYEQHLPTSFNKSSFETVWGEEYEELDQTCSCKFREETNVNQWLIKNWQIAEGKFVPRKLSVGRMFMYGEDGNYDEVTDAVRSSRYKMVCINDTDEIDDFDLRRDQLIKAFEDILPDRSQYELY